jgi:hypothetical protein
VIREIWHVAWLARYGFESLDGKVKRLERIWTNQDLTKNLYALPKHELNWE